LLLTLSKSFLKNPARLASSTLLVFTEHSVIKKPPIQAGRLLDPITVAGARNPVPIPIWWIVWRAESFFAPTPAALNVSISAP